MKTLISKASSLKTKILSNFVHCISASVKTPFVFFSAWRHNACVSQVSLHCLRHRLRFPRYGVTMYAGVSLRLILSFAGKDISRKSAFPLGTRHALLAVTVVFCRWTHIKRHLFSSNYSNPVLHSKKGRVCFVVISGTFHAINILTGWKLLASVNAAGVDTTPRKKLTCQCARVKDMTKRQQVGKAGLLFLHKCKKQHFICWNLNSVFWCMFWSN